MGASGAFLLRLIPKPLLKREIEELKNTGGYIVRLDEDRMDALESVQNNLFGEPVPEFQHSRNIPLVCFVVDGDSKLTHIASGRRGNMAGTGMRRLNLREIFPLVNSVELQSICAKVPPRFKHKIEEKFLWGGLVPSKTFQALLEALIFLAPEAASILQKYGEARRERIAKLVPVVQAALAEQKEAVATAMGIAGIERTSLQGWDIDESKPTASFLDGLEQVRLREDPMVINDLNNLPGFEAIKSTSYGAVVFQNNQSKLTVVLANRLPLEKQMGVDLIYYNETFSCFLMVQFKAMETEGEEVVFRFPQTQLTEEIDRMKKILVELKKLPPNGEADGFRISENPFFLKICPRIDFEPDNVGLVKGMYLPLDYWDLISQHPSMVGPKGGKRISYRNVRRYFDNTEFISIASGGWIGSNIEQSKSLEIAIRSTLESGRAVVFAVNVDKDSRHRQGGEPEGEGDG